MKKAFLYLLAGAAAVSVGALYRKNPSTFVQDGAIHLQDEVTAEAKEEPARVDRISQLFTTGSDKLPIVETVAFSPRVPWLEGRAAWIADYASFYGTSRHFIARSLNRTSDYLTQKVSIGDRFNVFRKDKKIEFSLLLDLQKREMHFSYIDLETGEKELLKTYKVAVGRENEKMAGGCLTPVGKFRLGQKIGIYKPGVMGTFYDEKAELIQIFGTRWIPLSGGELDENLFSDRGYGLQGAPWIPDPETGEYVESRECIGTYTTDGCVRLYSEDIEELFSIVITKPTTIEIVKQVDEDQENVSS